MKRFRLIYQKGFTLIELVVVMLIVVTVSSILVSTFFIISRATNKTSAIALVRQDGNYTLSQMEKNLRFSATIVDPASCMSTTTAQNVQSLTVQASDGTQTTYACDLPAQTIRKNAVSLFDTTSVSVTACSFTCSSATSVAQPTVSIDFTLNKKTSSTLFENNVSLPFHTSFTLQNVAR